MQKGYILKGIDYSLGANVLGVFSSKEAATQAREKYLEKESCQYGLYIDEF